MTRRSAVVLLLAAMLAAAGGSAAHGHAVLRLANPLENAALEQSPAAIRLTFSEAPDIALSQIRVVDSSGAAYEAAQPSLVPADPLTISLSLPPLRRGVYTVSWRIVSAVDGHATSGTYAFGVGADPASAAPVTSAASLAISPLDMVARWLLLVGLVLVVGAAAAALARIGGSSDVRLGAGGVALASAGLVLLAINQMKNAAIPVTQLLQSSVGRSLLARLAAVAIAAVALAAAGRRDLAQRPPAMAVALAASLAAIAIHVVSGHAAAAGTWVFATIASQWAHFAAAGLWIGGLAALLLGSRDAPSVERAEAVRRFSTLASILLVLVGVTGFMRTTGELRAWSELWSTSYGQAVLAKIAMTAGIAAFAAVNHWRSAVVAASDLRPLRRAGTAEVLLATAALAAAAVLGSLPPPAAGAGSLEAFEISGADFGTTLRVRVTGVTDRAGPNRFVAMITDYDSGESVDIRRATLRFTALDDPGIGVGSLELTRRADGAFVGSGSSLAVAGRWRMTALIERQGDAVEVSLGNVQIKSN